ncbi:MAG: hypothetical protein IT203_07640 [Fimbriimonadaceae bacterium]|nr:hypothetical protein [Fimbriimonadaceae bacterium]
MKKLLGISLTLGAVAMAMALSSFSKTFVDTYKVGAGSTLGKAACSVCHASPRGGKLNAYGKDVDAALKASGGKKVTAAVLKAVEGKDSDGDGKKNIDEIKADTMPGG